MVVNNQRQKESASGRSDAQRTIADFGEQWSHYTRNDGYYGSQELFSDIVGPLLDQSDLVGKQCAEIGAGTGRISSMLIRSGAAHVIAVEPSKAVRVLAANLAPFGDKVAVIQAAGDDVQLSDLDYVFSIGVLHHIPDPRRTVANMYRALKEGGQAVIWLYGREGNAAYLALAKPVRAITRRLPLAVNSTIAAGLYYPLRAYIALCAMLPLPMWQYMRKVLAPLAAKDVKLIIVDQINPAWAKYYTKAEAFDLLRTAGFVDVVAHHRHGYSWTVRGTKAVPGSPELDEGSAE